MKKNSLLLLLLIGVLLNFGFLESALASRHYNTQVDTWAYNEIVSTCSTGQATHFYSQSVFESLQAAGDLVAVKIQPTKRYFDNKGLSVRLKTILESGSIFDALHDCFGADQSKWDSYVARMIAYDVAGTFVGTTGGYVGALKLVKWLTGLANKKILSPLANATRFKYGVSEELYSKSLALAAATLFTSQAAGDQLIRAKEQASSVIKSSNKRILGSRA